MDLGPLDFGDENNPNDPGNSKRLQLAYKLDTSLVDPLAHLPNPPFSPPFSLSGGTLMSLAQRNLMRGWRMRLPSGQAIARAMGVEPLADNKILIIGGPKITGVDIASGTELFSWRMEPLASARQVTTMVTEKRR